MEENSLVHIRPDGLSVLGERVTIGHGAIIHGDRIDDFAAIGMGAIIGMHVVIGRWSIVAEEWVVTQGTEIGEEKFVTGVPGKIVGDIKDRHKDYWKWGKQLYVDLANSCNEKLKRID